MFKHIINDIKNLKTMNRADRKSTILFLTFEACMAVVIVCKVIEAVLIVLGK